ncbi:MAG: DUF6446 family protein [Pseudomonadota bacterium]
MSGRRLMIGLLGFTAIFAAALWYFQTHAFYQRTEIAALTVGGIAYPVEAWQGIDATTSPLKWRACFEASPQLLTAAETVWSPVASGTPLIAPSWFDCFDAEAIASDLAGGRASAFLIEPDVAHGADRYLALYPDGRAYAWHQLTPELAEQ